MRNDHKGGGGSIAADGPTCSVVLSVWLSVFLCLSRAGRQQLALQDAGSDTSCPEYYSLSGMWVSVCLHKIVLAKEGSERKEKSSQCQEWNYEFGLTNRSDIVCLCLCMYPNHGLASDFRNSIWHEWIQTSFLKSIVFAFHCSVWVHYVPWPQEGNVRSSVSLFFHSVSSVSFCSYFLRGNPTWVQWSGAELQCATAPLQWHSTFRFPLSVGVSTAQSDLPLPTKT